MFDSIRHDRLDAENRGLLKQSETLFDARLPQRLALTPAFVSLAAQLAFALAEIAREPGWPASLRASRYPNPAFAPESERNGQPSGVQRGTARRLSSASHAGTAKMLASERRGAPVRAAGTRGGVIAQRALLFLVGRLIFIQTRLDG